MRLIDADVLIEAIKNMSQRYCDCKDCDGRGQIIRVSEVIDIAKNEVPTAYDINKVVAELQKESYAIMLDGALVASKEVVIDAKRAIDVVKQGGKEN